jgi:N-acetylglucosamine kinase-like BadF-type ATPase
MTDIVERLRWAIAEGSFTSNTNQLLEDAAAKIEELRYQLAQREVDRAVTTGTLAKDTPEYDEPGPTSWTWPASAPPHHVTD